jgi:tripartite-type tricarboxylate transporter receptor subunit TctC
MQRARRKLLHLAAGALTLPALPRIAFPQAVWAQSYPTRPITMIVPYAAGGPTDTVGRIMAERMRDLLGQPVLVENVTGAAGSIGTGRAARAAPDGYTLSLGDVSTHVVNGAVRTLQYDVLNDFEPVCLLAVSPLLIVSRKTMPAGNLQELIAWLKANPDKATQGVAGASSQLAGFYFRTTTATRFQVVPYRGAAPAVQDMIAGHIDLMFPPASVALGAVRGSEIKAFAVAAKSRLAAAPEIPTVDEAGLPGFHTSIWQAFWAPKGTPPEIVGKLNAAVVSSLADAAVVSRLVDLGLELAPRDQQTPQSLGLLHKEEIAKWWPIIKAAGIKPE